MPAPVITCRRVPVSWDFSTLYKSSSLATASYTLHNLSQKKLPRNVTFTLQSTKSLQWSITVVQILEFFRWYYCCWSLVALLYFLWPFLFYMLDIIVTMSYANMRINKNLSNNVCCLNLYAWNSEVYIWE